MSLSRWMSVRLSGFRHSRAVTFPAPRDIFLGYTTSRGLMTSLLHTMYLCPKFDRV